MAAVTGRLTLEELTSMVPTGSCHVQAWDGVCEIWTYKVDLFSVDCVCLGFRRPDEACVEVSENMIGWNRLVECMQARFPGIPADWMRRVALPAFETNEVRIWPADESGSR